MSCPPFVDIHCHLTPAIDDGAKSWQESLAMAKMAVADGIGVMICTPHQLGSYSHNTGSLIRERVAQLQRDLHDHGVPLKVLPGGDVRIEAEMLNKLHTGEVVSLADHRKHVLLELPHELYVPLDGLIDQLDRAGIVGILSHPERNQGILKEPELIRPLVEQGCLMQVTAGSLMGTFGPRSEELSVEMLERNEVHFLATDAHSPKSRRPLMRRAFQRAADLVGEAKALEICCHNPAAVSEGRSVTITPPKSPARGFSRWFSWGRAA